MKGLILSGGKGTRLYPLTYTRAKQLIPVANKPVLFRVIEAIRDAGVTEIGIVIGDTGPEIRDAVGDGDRWGVRITYIPQDAPLGLAHAVKISRPFLGDDRFVMFLGDNVIQGGVSTLIEQFASSAWNAQVVLTAVAEPQHYGVAELEPDGRIRRLVEKPREPKSNLALVGIYMFDPNVHAACDGIEPSWRGELEITDAIQGLIDEGRSVEAHVVTGWWKDTGHVEDMLEANRLILDALVDDRRGTVVDSRIDGRVAIGEGALLERCHVRGPAVIGPRAIVRDAYIGPYTAISEDAVVERAELEHAIIMERSRVEGIDARLEDSLIGADVVITRSHGKPQAHRITVGDRARIEIL